MSQEDMVKALKINPEEWRGEIENIEEYYREFGDKMPKELIKELEELKKRFGF